MALNQQAPESAGVSASHIVSAELFCEWNSMCASATTVSFSGKIHGLKIHSRSAHFVTSQQIAPSHGP
jgi:hypothetical protein